MKTILSIAILAVLFTGCANSPVSGALYTNVVHSGMSSGGIVDNNVKAVKVGTSTCVSIAGLVAYGDCSISAAKEDAGIKDVHSIDNESFCLYGVYSSYTTVVTGK